MEESNKKLAFLFGAGAEIDYGMPSGIEFARNILFPSNDVIKKAEENAKKFGINFLKFTTTDIQGVIKSELDMHKGKIKSFFTELDLKYSEKLEVPKREYESSESDFPYVLSYIAKKYSENTEGNKKNYNLIKFLISMYVIWKGDDYVRDFSKNVVQEKKLESFLSDTDLLVLDYKKLFVLSRELVTDMYDGTSDESGDAKVLKDMAKELFEKSLNYQEFLSKFYENLFVPKEKRRTDSKFRKIASFLFVVQAYVMSKEESNEMPEGPSYYDILESKKDFYDIHIATTNYTHFLENIGIGDCGYLNGKLDKYINLDTFDILSEKKALECKNCVPFIFPQSAVKPLVSIDVMLDYANTYNTFSSCVTIAVIGFAFNPDDALLISMFRKLIKDERKILYFIYISNKADSAKIIKDEAGRLENIFSDKKVMSKIKIKPLYSDTDWFGIVENSMEP
ncbi:MAG: hypothetical protein SPL22_13675 [Treponema sp.]|uniref:hypothetical protein n=1 Tax=Treponema sp. TaxID=166 RepID=UPI002A91582D|nr:hypothetical protein [Treponema sp.]MDY6398759.1 hypothetical protein [Treponema sp.]